MLTFRNGSIGTITSSTGIYPAHKHLVEVNGENGSAIMNGEYDDVLFWEMAGSDEKNDFPTDFKLNDITDPHFLPVHGELLTRPEILVKCVRIRTT